MGTRTIAEIEAGIWAQIAVNPVLASLLTSESAVAEFAEWISEFATAEWITENLFTAHVAEVNDIIGTQKPHSPQWYATMAKAFQYGVALPDGSITYALVPPVDPTVLVVSEAVAVEYVNLLRVKVATLTGGVLGPLGGPQMAALAVYGQKTKDAGVRLVYTTAAGDNLQLALNVFYDPLVLTALGERIDGSENTPVMDAINNFIDNIDFNGVVILNDLIAAIRAVSGVKNVQVLSAQANYASTPYVDIDPQYVPDAGYLVLDETYFNANVVYSAYSV